MTPELSLWILFALAVGGALAVDLGLKSHRQPDRPVSFKDAAGWTLLWFALALAFCGLVCLFLGRQRALEFLTAYLVEESLSVDNMFVFVLIFSFFGVPRILQPRVLKWGIFGAVLMRFVLIFTGVALLKRFHWVLYVFGGVLVLTATKMLVQSESEIHPESNWLLRLTRRFVRVTSQFRGGAFFTRENGRRAATPLFATLLVIEASDLMFAMDSIPAVLAISDHPFIIFSSNVFAILGLRALFFLVSGIISLFRFLRYGLAAVLFFIGIKMLGSHYLHIPVLVSLEVVGACLGISILASVLVKPRHAS